MKKENIKNIAIIKLSALGDIIHTLPALALLRRAFPNARISWIVEPTGAKLLQNFTGIDEIIFINLKQKGLFNKIKEVKRIRRRYKKHFDLVLDFQGLLKSAVLGWLLNGGVFSGFHKENLKEPQARFFYDNCVDIFDESNHVALKNIHLASSAGDFSYSDILAGEKNGHPLQWNKLDIKTADLGKWEKSVADFLTREQLKPNHFIIINIGGGWETKVLPTRQYIEIIDALKARYKVVVLWGNEKEKKTAQEICRATGVAMADFFNFSQLILFIRYSRLIVTGDTLALHLADLVNTPSIGIFGPTSPSRNGSLMKESITILKKLPCRFCYKKKCGTIECIKKIKTSQILESIEKLHEFN